MPPGPTSTSTRFGSPRSTPSSSAKRTVARIWRAQVAGLVASAADIVVPVMLDSNGIWGSCSVMRDMNAVNSATTWSISREWKACEVRTRRAATPAVASAAWNVRMASSLPATTQLPGSLTVATSTSPVRCSATASTLSGTATMTPRGAACMSRARIETTLTAVSRSNTPASVAAGYSPMLCPAMTAGVTP